MSMRRPRRPLLSAAAALLVSAILVPTGIASAVTDGGADLGITKSGPETVVAGTTFSYTLDVTNDGDSPNEAGYTVTDFLPDGLAFVSGDGCTSETQEGTEVVTCEDDGIGVGGEESESFEIVVASSPSLAPGENALENTASIAPTDPEADPDDNPDNDDSTITSDVVAEADLSVDLAAPESDLIAGAGAGFDYTVTVSNGGPSDNAGGEGQGYAVSLTIPDGIAFSADGTTEGCTAEGQTVTCTDGTGIAASIEGGESYTVHALVPASAVPSSGEQVYEAEASVTTLGTPEPAEDEGPNSDTATVNVVARADLSITKTATAQVEDDLAYANSNTDQNQVEFSIEVSNAEQSDDGPSDAQNVVVTDVLPAGTTFVSASTGCTHDEGTVECTTEGPLVPGDSRTYTITVSVDADLRGGEANNFTNTADVSSDTPDIGGDEYPTTSDPTDPETRVHTVPDAPTNVHTESGNTNAVVSWTPTPNTPSANGGESVDRYVVTLTPQGAQPATCPTPGTLTQVVRFENGALADQRDTGPNSLRNGCIYDVVVQAENEVGLSDTAPSDTTAAPSRDKSAEILGNGNNEQFTGGGNTTNADLFVVKQSGTFASGTIGTLQEVTTGQPSEFPSPSVFCGGLACAANSISVNKFTDPTTGRYLLELRYGKQVALGTGQKRVYFSSDPDDPTGHQISGCPKRGPIPAATDACIVKLTSNASGNPAVLVLLSVRSDLIDPAAGTRR